MNEPLFLINLVVKDGEKYIRKCLEAALNQDFDNYQVMVFDNYSQDGTRKIVEDEFPEAKLIKFDRNYGLGGGFNRSLGHSDSKYAVLLCVDVILNPDFLKKVAQILEKDQKIGALQPKVLIWQSESDTFTNIIDTVGFEIFKSRRIINRGHGEEDNNQYKEGEIFSYEGACPVFKREALEDVKMPFNNGEYLDEDFEWYADDIDLGWRMRVLGWKSYFSPKAIAWHDRQTTKRLKRGRKDFIKLRRKIPAKKRMLDFRNQRLAIVKNEFPLHFLKDFPYFFIREIQLLIYFLLFEQSSLFGIFSFFKLLPKMLKKRRWITERRRISRKEMEKWFK
ncbi:MAG: hypothetical protein COV69_02280 [Parcubacteria group bacterium CG11_big_fil_rev_8_21_14_0_20_39_14]|nr:MAG: hypothetical protein COV69_02280 [Parcubacteria group bacterium CG11_big_fil_rev_8_21_14_0_20_39_14]PIS35409.1 MAG: hypothetical protein COT36_02435 [Parcubacteria group bacterium CG08_land_8_20_14_0_20_38_56]